jgi:hypothetical protein
MPSRLFGVLGLGALLLVGCTPPPAAELPSGVPAGAIRVNDNLYMVPIGADETGCPMYRAHAVSGMAAQGIYYRMADGQFALDRRRAGC